MRRRLTIRAATSANRCATNFVLFVSFVVSFVFADGE